MKTAEFRTVHDVLSTVDPHKLIRLKDVLKIVPVSRSTWLAWTAAGKAPKKIVLGTRTTCWRLADVVAFASVKEV